MLQKKTPGEPKPRDAEEVFEKLPYPVVLPTGSALDGRLRFEDFKTNRIQTFQLSNVPPDKKDTLALEIAEKLGKSLSVYDPSSKGSTFVVTNVAYDQANNATLTFSLRLSLPPTLLAKR